MKLYGNKLIRNRIGNQIKMHTESRDAILWDVLDSQRIARVKIQGSSELIVAHYPENWESKPYWLKHGNAVRISHTGGVRGRIELVGNGSLVPTPIAGDTSSITNDYDDAILTGLNILLNSGMDITVTEGTVRFSNSTYSVSSDTVTVNTAPSAGNYRYDIITVDSDLNINYTAGTASTNPAMPATPSGELLIGWLLISSSTTFIGITNINATFTTPYAHHMTMTISDSDLAYGEDNPTVTMDIFNQYNVAYSTSGTMTLEILSGTGTISDSGSKAFSGSSVSFTYTRATGTEHSPSLKAAYGILSAYGLILVRDASGNIL